MIFNYQVGCKPHIPIGKVQTTGYLDSDNVGEIVVQSPLNHCLLHYIMQ